ncbi:NHL repeat protein [Ancylostoma duodenale]|uniref:NHL repeat protein n=1 Tax=Ancylostoma duodenale TaxID=51022 RepID=A0A0C2GFJ7_9BILA|nr:NHL repeat protein [Ancylostoma duodenale]
MWLTMAYILPVSKQLGEVAGLAIDGRGRLVAFHRADREWDEKSFDEKEKFNKKLGPIKNATIAVIDPSNGKKCGRCYVTTSMWCPILLISDEFDLRDHQNSSSRLKIHENVKLRAQYSLLISIFYNPTQPMKYDKLIYVLEEHGKDMFYLPHGLTIDEKGNYWVTDVGSHQVHKLDSSFKPVLSLGEKLVPGDDAHHFCKPTDVAVAKNGYFFVADGYCNSRVMKFDPTGKLVDTFGAAGGDFCFFLSSSREFEFKNQK